MLARDDSDMCGSIELKSICGAKYFVTVSGVPSYSVIEYCLKRKPFDGSLLFELLSGG